MNKQGKATAEQIAMSEVMAADCAINELLAAINSAAFAEYHANRRLPGSDRTRRLRKKRQSHILNWYLDHYIPAQKRLYATRGPVAGNPPPENTEPPASLVAHPSRDEKPPHWRGWHLDREHGRE